MPTRPDADIWSSVLNELKTVKADDSGRFELKDLPTGRVTLSASAEGWAEGEEVRLELHPAEVLADVKLPLRAGGTVAGQVLGAKGHPDPRRPIEIELAGKRFDDTRRVTSDESARATALHFAAPGLGRSTRSRHMNTMTKSGFLKWCARTGRECGGSLDRKGRVVTFWPGITVAIELIQPQVGQWQAVARLGVAGEPDWRDIRWVHSPLKDASKFLERVAKLASEVTIVQRRPAPVPTAA